MSADEPTDEEALAGEGAARALLLGLLDGMDSRPDRIRDVLVRPDYNAIPPGQRDAFHQAIERAATNRAILVERDTQARRTGTISRVRLVDADLLANSLGVSRAAEKAATVVATLRPRAMTPWSQAVLADLSEAWRIGGSAHSLRAEDGDAAGAVLAVLDAIHAGKHAGLDMRTFSRRCFGDSKLVERVGASVASVLRRHAGLEGATTQETMAAAGLVKWPMPILIRAVLVNRVSGERLAVSPYVGLPVDCVLDFNFATEPAYFLTIENLTSFYRQCIECQDDGAVLYTGGFPSPRALDAIRHLGAQVREAHRFHWGDIDGGGVRIFHHIENALPGLRPHLMSGDLAKNGKPMDKDGNRKSLSKIASINSPIAGLAQWLISPDGRCLEQEELDPQSPTPIDL